MKETISAGILAGAVAVTAGGGVSIVADGWPEIVLVALAVAGASFTGLAAETGVNHITIRTFLIGRGVTLRHDHGGHRKRGGRRTGRGHGR